MAAGAVSESPPHRSTSFRLRASVFIAALLLAVLAGWLARIKSYSELPRPGSSRIRLCRRTPSRFWAGAWRPGPLRPLDLYKKGIAKLILTRRSGQSRREAQYRTFPRRAKPRRASQARRPSCRTWPLGEAAENVVIGERMAANLRASGMPEDRIHVIPNWCNDTAIRPAPESNNPLRGAWGLEGKFVVGYSGNLGRAHEFETILGAASRLWSEPGIVFLIIGGGHFVEAFSRRVKELHLDQRFRFLPYQDQATLNYSLGVPNLHWISLKPELEGLIVPSKFYSIAAAGRPMVVIGASDGELATLVQRHHCGYVVEPGDSAALADLLKRIARDSSVLPEMGIAARTMLDAHFSRRQAFEKWQKVFGEMDPATHV
jgi:glycosyltransferase involved in cell wall biosynthesis